MRRFRYVFFLCLTALACQTTWLTAAPDNTSKIGYISDFLVINIRDNLERPFTVIEAVHSGEKVIILDREGEYLRVQTEEGKIGWISSKYVKYDTPKPVIIAQLNEQLAALQAQLDSTTPVNCADLQQQLQLAKSKISSLEQDVLDANNRVSPATEDGSASYQDTIDHLQESLNTSKEQYSLLAEEHVKRGEKIAELQNIVAKLNDKSKYFWFAAGGLVFFIGLLAGKSGGRKKSKFMY